ncbi:hypothetical protein ACFVGN_30180 [Streptomyces sp. NPDC057757]|uniref:hypothetical protein n=1 Tax=Streptomyces sp. NPDC057757 TaxID=3346241 RepID=UPI0036BA4817
MFDSALGLMTTGYARSPDQLRRSRGKPVRTRLGGRNVVALHGPEAVRFFYDESTSNAVPQAKRWVVERA